MNSALCGLLLFGALPVAVIAQPCPQPDLKPLVRQAKTVQSRLLAFRLQDEMDETVPAPLQTQIGVLKDAFAALADAAFACAPANIDPKTIEKELAKSLDANKPEAQEVYDPKKPPQVDQIYGSNVAAKVSRSQSQPQLLLVEFNFGIECGFDSVLLAYDRQGSAWKQVVRWQSSAYDRVDAAFGDFFDYVVLPQKNLNGWFLVVAHGSPWCSSNFSAFDIDLLQPSAGGASQKVLDHMKIYYRRDEDPVMKAVGEGFQLRMLDESIDPGIVMRPVIFRFQILGGRLVRVQPIALNGRDFVDEWLQSPWSDASRWSATPGPSNLELLHKKLADIRNAKDAPLLTFGPVRSCTDAKAHFQVELDEEWVDDKGGSRPGPTTYFQIEEGNNSFTMLSSSSQADPKCTGSDIMSKQ